MIKKKEAIASQILGITSATSPNTKINRASVKYDSGLGGGANEVKIENDRLKTTIMILT